LQKFIDDKIDFEEAFQMAEDKGGTNSAFKKIGGFRLWLAAKKNQDRLIECPPKVRLRVEFEVKQLQKILKSLEKRMSS
jgi:hypothetical protein